jgi:hypothetical protein
MELDSKIRRYTGGIFDIYFINDLCRLMTNQI